ncbi:MAG: hypothetical protein J1D87_10205 [Lachnospiraceae bacterium]|nr:hypothetical protein [Lachnospiraceae bacterium]
MDREIEFAKTLELVKNTSRQQGNCISKEQIEEAFSSLELGKDKIELVFDYLKKSGIGIGEPLNPDEYLSKDEVNYLEAYLEQLKELPGVTEGEKEAITLSAMAGDLDAQKRLINIFLPQVVDIAKLYAGQGVFLEDLIGEGNVAVTMGVTMLGALDDAAEAQGVLGKMVMDAMEEYISENAEAVKKHRQIADKVNRVADKANELSEDLHRKVTVEELMEETGMSEKYIKDAIRISGDKIESIES